MSPSGPPRALAARFSRALFMGPLLALATLLCGCRTSLLDPAGPVGAAERTLLLDALALMLAIVIPTLLAVLATAFWFRAGNVRAVRRPTFAYSGRLELLVWSIPALTVLFLGGVAWVSAHDLDPARPLASRRAPLEIDVVAMDWKWLFIYPAEGVASVNRLVAPAGTPLRLRVTSASVFNGFFVPALGSQIYAMNGMVEELNLMAARQGRFHGLSSHFSGDGFADMGFEVEATSDAGFAAFLAGAKAAGGLLDAKAYARLEAPGVAPAPVTFGALAPRLFDTVALARSDAAPAPPSPPPQALPRPPRGS